MDVNTSCYTVRFTRSQFYPCHWWGGLQTTPHITNSTPALRKAGVGEERKDRWKGREGRKQGWCNERRRNGHFSISAKRKRSWPGWQNRSSLCVLSRSAGTHAVTEATVQSNLHWNYKTVLGLECVLCCTLQRSFVKHCPALWLLCLWRQLFFRRLSRCWLRAANVTVYLFIANSVISSMSNLSKVTGNQVVIFYSNMQII